MTKHLLSVLAFMLVSFGVQGLSHFVINQDHYAGIFFMRDEPIIALGLLAMILQGSTMTLALARSVPRQATVRDGLTVSLAFGLFLTAYIALAAPAKYAVPSISVWIGVEGLASLIQFSVFGVFLGLIHRKLA